MTTKQEWLAQHRAYCDRMCDITARKNSDYNKGDDDAFANFKVVENMNIAPVEIGFLTRMTDKLSRINSLLSTGGVGKVKDESIEDTLLDLANYSLLLAGYLASKRSTPKDGYSNDKEVLFGP